MKHQQRIQTWYFQKFKFHTAVFWLVTLFILLTLQSENQISRRAHVEGSGKKASTKAGPITAVFFRRFEKITLQREVQSRSTLIAAWTLCTWLVRLVSLFVCPEKSRAVNQRPIEMFQTNLSLASVGIKYLSYNLKNQIQWFIKFLLSLFDKCYSCSVISCKKHPYLCL